MNEEKWLFLQDLSLTACPPKKHAAHRHTYTFTNFKPFFARTGTHLLGLLRFPTQPSGSALKAAWTETSEDFWIFGYQKYYPSMLNFSGCRYSSATCRPHKNNPHSQPTDKNILTLPFTSSLPPTLGQFFDVSTLNLTAPHPKVDILNFARSRLI
jgi:hypothetical protein